MTRAVADSRSVLLRTTADVLDNVISQTYVCEKEWPNLISSFKAIREGIEDVVRVASGVGFVSKRIKR